MSTPTYTLRSVSFRGRRGPLLLLVAGAVVFSALLIDALFFHVWNDWDEILVGRHQIPLVLTTLAYWILALPAMIELYHWPTRLGADATGLWLAHDDENPGYRVPWTAVREVAYRVEEPSRDRPDHWLELRLREDAWHPPTELVDRSYLEVPLVDLERPPTEVYSAIRSCWDRWRRAQATAVRVSPT